MEIAVSGTAVPGSEDEHGEVGEKYEISEHVDEVLAVESRTLKVGGTGRRVEKEVVRLSVGIPAVRTGVSATSIAPWREEPP
jgi:hypothetical protein